MMKPIAKSTIRTAHGTFEYALSVRQSPPIVLINGGSGPIEGWHKIFHELAAERTVLAYNRPGIGGSGKPAAPQDGLTITSALKQLLDDLELSGPCVLVGHSLGGLYANLFARRFPERVAGVVLLEAGHPRDLEINASQPAWVRLLNRLLGSFDGLFPARKWNEVHYVGQTAAQIAQAGPFPDKPLFVLTGARKPPMMPDSAWELRRSNQQDLVRMSPQGRQVLAERSGHFPQMSEPELTVGTIRACAYAAEAGLASRR